MIASKKPKYTTAVWGTSDREVLRERGVTSASAPWLHHRSERVQHAHLAEILEEKNSERRGESAWDRALNKGAKRGESAFDRVLNNVRGNYR